MKVKFLSQSDFLRTLNEQGELLANRHNIDVMEAKKRILRLINSKRLNELQPGTMAFKLVTDAYFTTPSNQPIPTDAKLLNLLL